MHLEQMQAAVDRLRQSHVADQLMHQPDAAVGRAARAARQLILRRAAADHWPREILGIVVFMQTSLQSSLANPNPFPDNGVHSKSFLCLRFYGASTPMKPHKHRRTSSFFMPPFSECRRIRLFEV